MVVSMICITVNILYARRLNTYVRINVGLVLFLVSLLVVPVMDLVYVKGEVGLYNGYYATIGGVVVSGVADGLVQGGVVGSAGESKEKYGILCYNMLQIFLKLWKQEIGYQKRMH